MNDQVAAGTGAAADGIAAASQSLQAFASEMQQMGKESMEQATQALEALRNAKSVQDVVALQTTFMQQAFQRYTAFASRMGEVMTAGQADLVKQSQAAMQGFKLPFG